MAYTVREWLVDGSKYGLKCPYSMTPKFITIHNTSNSAPAVNEVSYMRSNSNATSFHVAIDDKEAIIGIPFNRNAWHTGDGAGVNSGNRTSIGIEICYSTIGGDKYRQAEDNAAHYTAQLLKKYGWGIDRVKQHWDFPRPKDGYRKNCPHRIRDEGRWGEFLAKVKLYLNGVQSTENKPVENTEEELSLNETGRNAIKSLLKKAAAKGEIDKGVHTDAKISGYSDRELISYAFAVINKKY